MKYPIGNQTIIHDDGLIAMRAMLAASVDVIVTSPPYNIGADYNQHNDRQPRDAYLAWLTECFVQWKHALRSSGSLFLNIGAGTKDDPSLPFMIIERVLNAGFVLQNNIMWVKAIAAADGVIRGHCKPVNSDRFLMRTHEFILHLTKSGDVPLSKLAIGVPYADKSNIERRGHAEDKRDRGTAWFITYDTVQSSKVGKFDHPAGFPIELPEWCLRLHRSTRTDKELPWFVRPNLVVLDPFAGTGTTVVAAHRLGCRGIGIEKDSQYVETARKRLEAEPAVAPVVTAPPALPLPAHSPIGPSQGELVWNCPGSVRAQEAAGPRIAGEAAARGTELHSIAEDCLRNGASSKDPVVGPYLDIVRAVAARADVKPLIEQRLDLSRYHPQLFGTSDAIVVNLAWGVLTVFDLKSGLIHVDADALQLKIYAGMAFMALPLADQRKIKFIDTVVVQPANGTTEPVRQARHTVADILNTLSTYIDRAHVATDDPDPPLQAGPWCRAHFCSARTSCDAFRAMTVREAQAEFTKEAAA